MAVVKNLGKEEIEITLEDQQQINTFARQNTRMEELKVEIETKKNDLKNLEDASDELLMVEESVISYKVGEVFIQMAQEDIEDHLEKARTRMKDEITSCEEQFVEIQEVLKSLKAKLYGKFGNSINLEADEE
ncbi:prefoldin subunit 4-like [Dendronephthya gigantea]|uniref:prefoldin subunit 4-like n=1 Tax=Dendronephthya gigantea TaxID=151771 RepID=UPI00106BCE50|nr:prefoldin subunit 4-like [Dendronephthya gigantea]